MYKIKVLGVFIFVLSMVLVLVFNTISKQNRVNNNSLSIINEQKFYTQEISKSVLYLSKNKGSSTDQLDTNIKKFLENMKHNKIDSAEHDALVALWKTFYADVEQFREKQKVTTAYSSIILDTLVNTIYMKNQKLIIVFNTFIEDQQKQYDEKMEEYKNVEYILFSIVALLLMYLFTQIREIITFIQKFSTTSKSIIQKSTIKDLQPMQVCQNDECLKEATQNFNQLVEKINFSIVFAQESIEHTTEALEVVEQKIEDLMSLISQMQQEGENDALYQKEDAVIDSLETLMNLTKQLKNLQQDLNKLTSTNNFH